MSIYIDFIDCDNNDQSSLQLARGLFQLNVNVAGINAVIIETPESQLQQIQCDEQKSLSQLFRESLIIDDNGNIAIRLFQGV